MKILFLGDVVGRSGRDAVAKHLPQLRKIHALDFVVVNGENAAGGFGMTPEIYQAFLDAGADAVTAGDHVWDQKSLIPRLGQEKRLLRPHNFPETAPGCGLGEYALPHGKTVIVLHLLGQVFIHTPLDCPFAAAEKALAPYRLGHNAQAILVDFHAEATSEKCAMGHFLDGRVSLVVGSHTHIPTADAHLLPGGTAYQTDAGMCGDYNSIIGFDPAAPLEQFTRKIRPQQRKAPANGEATLCGTLVETDDKTGLATSIAPLRIGGVLTETA